MPASLPRDYWCGFGVGRTGFILAVMAAFRDRKLGVEIYFNHRAERCLEAYHLDRTRFELIAERKLRNRQLTDDGNVEINGGDLRALSKAGAEVRVASIGL
jgi:hypothetical protein